MKGILSLRRRAGIVLVLLVIAGGGWWMLSARGEADWVEVVRDDLVLSVDVTGTLKAVDSSQLGPPQVPEVWDYKIALLADEGEDVKKGQPVLRFDTTDLQRRLDEKSAERDAAEKKIEQREADNLIRRRQDDLRLAEAEARLRKATLKAEVPEEVIAGFDLRRAQLDLDVAGREVEHIKRQIASTRASDEAALKALQKEYDHAEGKVAEITRAIEQMTVRSPRDGVVVYVTNWRGEKKKVGDSCWVVEKVVEIPDLSRMMAEGEVDESDGGAVAVGQKVKIRLDAHPDDELTGKVKSIGKTVQRQAGPFPLKVIRVRLELDRTDPVRMRPGMRFRGKIQVGLVSGAILVPSEAVFLAQQKPTVYRRSFFGFDTLEVSLGRRNENLVEVVDGLRDGDMVARRDMAVSKERGR